MKKTIIVLLSLFCISAHAQDIIQLKIDNPGPRVGDNVELTFSIDFLTDELKRQLGDEIELTNSTSYFGSGDSRFKRVIQFQKSGKYTLGPFQFEFNGRKIVTDSIEVNVAEKLPFEPGVWIRYVAADGKHYLILEQLIKNESDYQKQEDGFSYTVGGKMNEKEAFTEIINSPEKGVGISFKSSRSRGRSQEGGGLFDVGMTYSIKKYEIEFSDSFDGTLELRKKHFTNWPKGVDFTIIKITP